MTSIIGESLPRPDATGKVTGATHYPADLIKPEMYQLQVVFAGLGPFEFTALVEDAGDARQFLTRPRQRGGPAIAPGGRVSE